MACEGVFFRFILKFASIMANLLDVEASKGHKERHVTISNRCSIVMPRQNCGPHEDLSLALLVINWHVLNIAGMTLILPIVACHYMDVNL